MNKIEKYGESGFPEIIVELTQPYVDFNDEEFIATICEVLHSELSEIIQAKIVHDLFEE